MNDPTISSLFDSLDLLASDAGADTGTVLAVWAARVAATDGDMLAADEWARQAAQGLGRLF